MHIGGPINRNHLIDPHNIHPSILRFPTNDDWYAQPAPFWSGCHPILTHFLVAKFWGVVGFADAVNPFPSGVRECLSCSSNIFAHSNATGNIRFYVFHDLRWRSFIHLVQVAHTFSPLGRTKLSREFSFILCGRRDAYMGNRWNVARRESNVCDSFYWWKIWKTT